MGRAWGCLCVGQDPDVTHPPAVSRGLELPPRQSQQFGAPVAGRAELTVSPGRV